MSDTQHILQQADLFVVLLVGGVETRFHRLAERFPCLESELQKAVRFFVPDPGGVQFVVHPPEALLHATVQASDVALQVGPHPGHLTLHSGEVILQAVDLTLHSGEVTLHSVDVILQAGDLLHAVDHVRSVVEDGFTLADAADALGPDAEEASGVESLPLEPGRDDVVRLMNLHKAKGLEAPVVFLADPRSGVAPRVDVRVVREADKALGYFLIDRKVGEFGRKVVAEPPDWHRHQEDELQYLHAEEQRLLYVAATRAKDVLVVSRWAKNGGRGGHPWEVFEAFLTKAQELKVPASVAAPALEKVDLSAKAAEAAAVRAAAMHERARQASWATSSVGSETKSFLKATSAVAAPDDPTRVVSADTPSRRADAGAAWGSLVHGLLEHALRHQHATREDLRRLALWLTVDELDLRPFIDEAVATVEAVSRKEFWAEAKASPECHEEVPFSIKVSADSAGVPKVLNGTIDSVFRQAAGWKIVDYKTDVNVTAAVLQQRYGEQLAAYVSAWRRFVDGEVTSVLVQARAQED